MVKAHICLRRLYSKRHKAYETLMSVAIAPFLLEANRRASKAESKPVDAGNFTFS